MTKNEKDLINELVELFNKMYAIIASNPSNDSSYGKKNIIKIVDYLKEELSNDVIEYKEIISTIIEPYKSMFPPKGGLSDFHIWDNDYKVRYKANHTYDQIKKQIEEMLNSSK